MLTGLNGVERVHEHVAGKATKTTSERGLKTVSRVGLVLPRDKSYVD